MTQRYEYLVEQILEDLLGRKMSVDKVQQILNDKAQDGWRLKEMTAVRVKGRFGPGGAQGVLVTFERPVA